MKPLNIVLIEAGLELVPKEIQHHPAVVKSARRKHKKPFEVLLDISLHYSAMKELDKWYKRGRPDIVHICLLNALSSPLNITGLLRVYVHTINNSIIYIDPAVRLPRNYDRFVGLMEQLLVLGKVPPDSEKPLMWVESASLTEFLRRRRVDSAILMHEQGARIPLREFGKKCARLMNEDKEVYVFVGAFQRGEFEEEVFSLINERFSIFDRPLDAWVVVSRVIESVEIALGIC
uniref:Ribosomal RNA small subunit methyltransferase Nep1 n=1 Tax=Ignisphaera aggregans TaxID=334771 RepID=A0A7C2ZM49_9CREN